MLRFHALAVIALSGMAAAAADPLPTETFKVLPLTLAVEAAQAAMAACKAEGFATTAAVVDRAGNLQVLLAGDGVSVLSRDLARRKAYTAAVRRLTTIELAKAIAAPGAFNPMLYDTQMAEAGCRSRWLIRSSAASASAARQAARRTKRVPMRVLPRSVIA
jgi:uncharacterized protein GlcG (DUF336 family)